MTRNGYSNSSHRPPPFRQVEIARAEDGSRRLFRAEVHGVMTGFVEKQFRGDTMVREFALGGPVNGIDEVKAKSRFMGADIQPIIVKKKTPATPRAERGLPDFITKSEPMMRGKSARPRAGTPPIQKKVSASEAYTPVRGPRSRKDAMALAGSISTRHPE